MQENVHLSAAQSSTPAPPASSLAFPTSLNHPCSFPRHRLVPPSQIDAARAGGGRLPQGSARRSLDFIFIYYYSLLLFIYSFLFLFPFERAQLCHLGFAENVNKKAAFKCSLSWHEYVSHPTQLQCSHPEIKTQKKATSSLYITSIPPSNVLFVLFILIEKQTYREF